MWNSLEDIGYAQSQMRRVLAIAMTVLFSLALAAPLLAGNAENSLPACCRRDGRHHCSNAKASGESAPQDKQIDRQIDRQIERLGQRCPLFPQPMVPGHVAAFEPVSSDFFAGAIGHPAIFSAVQAQYRISAARSHHKRGPPARAL